MLLGHPLQCHSALAKLAVIPCWFSFPYSAAGVMVTLRMSSSSSLRTATAGSGPRETWRSLLPLKVIIVGWLSPWFQC